jgi:RNA polymerase sigma-70 factor (ECF subfamily)
VVRRALELMREDFEPATWQACWRTVAEDQPTAEVATALGISENAVYIARSRVLRRLRRELDGLLD